MTKVPTKADLEREIEVLKEVLKAFRIKECGGSTTYTDVVFNSFSGLAYSSSKDENKRVWVQPYTQRGW